MLYSLDSPSCELHVSFGFRRQLRWFYRDFTRLDGRITPFEVRVSRDYLYGDG